MSDVIYTVKIVAQHYNKATIAKIAALFKKSGAQIEAALASGDIVAKKNFELAAAEQLKLVIEERTGAECMIDPPVETIDDFTEVVKPAATKAHPSSTTPEPPLSFNRFSIMALVSLILLVVGGSYYYYWTSTAAYSLAQIQRAVDEHDLELFEKHVDYKNMILVGARATVANEAAEAHPSSSAGKEQERKTAEQLALELEIIVRQDGELPLSRGQTLSAVAATLREIQIEGKPSVAHATVEFPKFENKTFTLIFSLRKMADHWEIFELENIAELRNWQAEQEADYLSKANQEIVNRINASISQINFKYNVMPANPFMGPELRIAMSFVNSSDNIIKTIYCNIDVVLGYNGQTVATQYFSWGDGSRQLAPGAGALVTKDIASMASPGLNELLSKPNPVLKFNYEISSISFADGSELIPFRSYSELP
ncbi:MAG: hypothetical protein ACI89D_001300 [Bermanella sp.]|jgi:hypothetical protein